jgi:hypothetical protein
VDDQYEWIPRETDPGSDWQGQPAYGWPPQLPPAQPPQRPSNQNRRNAFMIGGAAVLALVLVVALINGLRTRGSSQSSPTIAAPVPTVAPTNPASPGPQGGGIDPTLPVVACPYVVDDQSHLAYRCIDNSLVQSPISDSLLGLRIELNLEVEPGWIISEGSGNPLSVLAPTYASVIGSRQALPTTAQVTAEVKRRTALAVSKAYGDEPSSTVLSEHALTVSGAVGYELVTEITINAAYRATRKLATKTERLWVVGVPTKAGISVFMMSIPDRRTDLWSKAAATVGTLRIT